MIRTSSPRSKTKTKNRVEESDYTAWDLWSYVQPAYVCLQTNRTFYPSKRVSRILVDANTDAKPFELRRRSAGPPAEFTC